MLLLICGTRCLMDAQSTAPVPVAIVGLVHGHVQGLLDQLPRHPEVRLVGIAEPDEQLQQKYAALFHLDRSLFFPSTEAMLAARHPEAILVYTSIAGHRAAIEAAAAHGVASMVEKPLATTMDDALAIRRASRDHHVPVLVNYETTWYASNRAAYNQVQKGRIGGPWKVVVHDGHNGPVEIGVPPEFLKWLTDPRQNGAGALFDFGCYGVDLMTWLMHGATPLSVTAVTQHLKPQEYPQVDDDATIIITYPHAQAIVQGSWDWPFARKDMEVYGATGYIDTVYSEKTQDGLRVRYAGGKAESTQTAPPLPAPEDSSLDYLLAVLHGKLQPHGDLSALDTNMIVMQILDAARTSAQTGRTVPLHPLPE